MPTKGRKISRASESYCFGWDCIDWRQSLCYFPFCKSESFEILMLGSELRWIKSLFVIKDIDEPIYSNKSYVTIKANPFPREKIIIVQYKCMPEDENAPHTNPSI